MSSSSETSLSMLNGLREHNPEQWDRFVQLFGPLVYEWCRRRQIPEHDAADIVQEVFSGVSKQIAGFRKEKPTDTFRGWLRQITHYKVADHFRRVAKQAQPRGGSSANAMMHNVAFDVPSTLDDDEDSADRQALYLRALELLESSFKTHTWRAFWLLTIEEQPAKTIAKELNMTPGAVYNARYKVQNRLRLEFAELL